MVCIRLLRQQGPIERKRGKPRVKFGAECFGIPYRIIVIGNLGCVVKGRWRIWARRRKAGHGSEYSLNTVIVRVRKLMRNHD